MTPTGGDISIDQVVATENGVTVVAQPDIVLYDAGGNELARVVWSAASTSIGAVASPGGGIATLTYGGGLISIRTFDSQLEELVEIPLDAAHVAGLAISGDSRYALVGDNPFVDEPQTLQLLTVGAGAITDTITVVANTDYRRWATSGLQVTANDAVVACTTRSDPPGALIEILRIAPTTGAVEALEVRGTSTEASIVYDAPCELVETSSGLAAVWIEFQQDEVYVAATLLDSEGRQIIEGPAQTQTLPRYSSARHFVYDGESVVGMSSDGDLYGISIPTLLARPPCAVATGPAAQFLGFGHGLAALDGHLYAGLTPSLFGGPRHAELLKLAPLTGP